ncbi:DUF488 family protein [Methanoregula sp.]|uniref:DUF488 domain-containing protein n=1 Tax=Methanoregula sp. TaxID=2052170 RepID=UPI0026308F33|nr:DUF488 family protein [Methanoregula sp.]MDD5144485.1 DUF488 family protein [Methanoregula sp.]
MIRAKHILDPVSADDGLRVLIEPAWPRGVGRSRGPFPLWLKDLAPSQSLLARLRDDTLSWGDFVLLYSVELEKNRDYFSGLQDHNHHDGLTLLHASPDNNHNAATALKMILDDEDRMAQDPRVV